MKEGISKMEKVNAIVTTYIEFECPKCNEKTMLNEKIFKDDETEWDCQACGETYLVVRR